MKIQPRGRVSACLLTFALFATIFSVLTTDARGQEGLGAASFWTVAEAVEGDFENGIWLSGISEGFVIRVRLDYQTTLLDPLGGTLAPEEVTAGSILYVKAEWTNQGLLAKFVSVSDPSRVIVTGVVEQLSAGRLRVAGLEFVLEGPALTEYIPAVGQMVTVQAQVTANGALALTSVKPQNNIELSGKIEKLEAKSNTEGMVQVCSKSVAVTDQTVILSPDKVKMTIPDLVVGLYVKILGRVANGEIVATSVVAADPKRVSVTGIVTAFDSTSISLKAADQTVVTKLNSATKIEGSLAIGATVFVEASLEPDGSLLALVVRVKGTGDAVATIRGAISSRGTDFIVVSGVKVTADPSLPILSPGAQQLKFSDLKVGDLVEISGAKQASGTVLALKIALLPPPPPASVKGVISSLGVGFFLLGDLKVLVDEKTVIRSKETPLKFADLKIGDPVTVYGSKGADGSLQAEIVDVMPPSPYSSVRGAIASVAADSFVVGGVTVKINEKTVITAEGKQILLKDLKVGDWVEVAGIKQSDGTLVAAKVAVVPPNTSTIFAVEGVIESVGADYLVVSGMKILVTEKTAIREGDKALKFSDLKAGMKVGVAASKQGDALTAIKIKVVTTGGK